MEYLYKLLTWIMNGCYGLCKNYGLAIILFTFCTKIILLPVSLWTYFNSITMIKIQPDINFLKVKYYGQKDTIAEEQAKLFKEKKYHPLLTMFPTIIQLVLLAGVVEIVKRGIANPSIDMTFGPVNLGLVPSREGIRLLWSPIIAGFSSWILCMAQNASNVLQSEQSKYNKYGTMALSVGLSLYLGWFVAVGTALYWVCSNLLAVAQMYILNAIIRPRRYVDYDKLEESRKALVEIQGVGKKKRESFFSENKRRERADYKRFFSVVNKHLVIYSESNGFYKYFRGIVEYLLAHTNVTIHYITSDPDDHIFELAKEKPQIRPYYIGENKLITLMMKMDADIVVMTMPDLDNYHIKRSYVRKDIEYIYVPHGMNSGNMTTRPGARDNFDTIFCAGPHQKEETEQLEVVYGTKKKNIVEFGYCLLDDMIRTYEQQDKTEHAKKKILIAPSWQPDNIIDSCLEKILNELKKYDYEIIVRPHPQHVRHKEEYMKQLQERYREDGIEIQTDFSSENPVMEADLLITDWSGIAWEYSFTTLKPTLYINTPMKVINPEYQKIDSVPVDISLRNDFGKSLDLDDLDGIAEVVRELLMNREKYQSQLKKLRERTIYNVGNSGQRGAEYIISRIQETINKKK